VIATKLEWSPAFRLIAARLPRLDIFERVTAPGDLPAILELEAITNPRLRPLVGPLAALPPEDRLSGPGASFVMAAFAYTRAARFSDERAGAYYAGESLATSVAEVSFHRARFAARTPTPPMDFDERIVEARIAGRFSDIRGLPPDDPLYDPDPERYGAPQVFAARERSGCRLPERPTAGRRVSCGFPAAPDSRCPHDGLPWPALGRHRDRRRLPQRVAAERLPVVGPISVGPVCSVRRRRFDRRR
jgi:hypothetical protein